MADSDPRSGIPRVHPRSMFVRRCLHLVPGDGCLLRLKSKPWCDGVLPDLCLQKGVEARGLSDSFSSLGSILDWWNGCSLYILYVCTCVCTNSLTFNTSIYYKKRKLIHQKYKINDVVEICNSRMSMEKISTKRYFLHG
jgi:hypothetical protein